MVKAKKAGKSRGDQIDPALRAAANSSGSLLIRSGKIVTGQNSTEIASPSNSAMAIALKAAGIAVEPKQPADIKATKVEPDKKVTKKAPAKSKRNRAKVPPKRPEKAVKAKAQVQKRRKAQLKIPKVPASIAVAVMDAERAKRARKREAKVESDHIVELRKKANEARRAPASQDWWSARRRDLTAFATSIDRAPFCELLLRWKECRMRAADSARSGLPPDRREFYTSVLKSIENEWAHRAKLAYSTDAYFDWPTTFSTRGSGSLSNTSWVAEGMLSYLGYEVGQSSELDEYQRHDFLRRIFGMILPPIESPTYVAEWGPPSSALRLKKMANSIAAFARSAKRRRSGNWGIAITEWETDLKMLHREYYVGKFGFGWPQT